MPVVLNLVYLMAFAVLLPWLVWRRLRTVRYRAHLAAKLRGRIAFENPRQQLVAWFHGVSVGEIHLLSTVIVAFRRRHPNWRIVISSTTDSGLAAAESFGIRLAAELPIGSIGSELTVIPWPFDFSWAVRRAFATVRPQLLVLAEGELWPNAVRIADQQGIRVAVINARLSPRSASRYRRVAAIARSLLFRHISRIGVQSESYAQRFRELGLPDSQLIITGSVKYDGAMKPVLSAAFLRSIPKPNLLLWVAGSTHAPEERIVLNSFRDLSPHFPQLRLILVPRHPDRFADVAALLESMSIPFVKRSTVTELSEWPLVLLLDTVGELSAAWSVADVGYVGGSLDEGRRGGQSMIEPAGCGVSTVFGPRVWNFREAAEQLVACDGSIQIRNASELTRAMIELLADPMTRQRRGQAALAFVRSQQGATERTIDMLTTLMDIQAIRQAA